MDETGFETWLEQQGYSASTVRSTVRMVRRAREAHADGEPLEPFRPYVRRWVTFAGACGRTDAFAQHVERLFGGVEPSPEGPSRKDVLTYTQWTRILQSLQASGDFTDIALHVVLAHRYPAQDLRSILTEPLTEVRKEVPKDVAYRLRPFKHCASLMEVISGRELLSYDTVYMRLRRRMAAITRATDIDFDLQSVERTPWKLREDALS